MPVEDLLSRGQLKLLMCALRLAQGEYFTRQSGQQCLYLLDDFASELDAGAVFTGSPAESHTGTGFVSAITLNRSVIWRMKTVASLSWKKVKYRFNNQD